MNAYETSIADHLDAVVTEFPQVAVGSYPHFEAKDYKVKVTFDARVPGQAAAACQALHERLGDLVFSVEDET